MTLRDAYNRLRERGIAGAVQVIPVQACLTPIRTGDALEACLEYAARHVADIDPARTGIPVCWRCRERLEAALVLNTLVDGDYCPRCTEVQPNIGPWREDGPWRELCRRCKVEDTFARQGAKAMTAGLRL